MVAQKITCQSRGDDIGKITDLYTDSTDQGRGFFASESRDSATLESATHRSFKPKKETGERVARSNGRRKYGNITALTYAKHQLFRGKSVFETEFLKQEPLESSTMLHETDCEFFQDLVQWCSAPAKDEQIQTIDSQKVTEARAFNTAPHYTPLSPQGWETFDANSPTTPAGVFPTTPYDPLSPNLEGFMQFDANFVSSIDEKRNRFKDQFLDINSLPVVIEDFASEKPVSSEAWAQPVPYEWSGYYTKKQENTHNIMPFIEQEDSLDMKLVSVIPRQLESNDVVVSEFVLNKEHQAPRAPLALNISALATPDLISTPDVLTYVEQLEKEKLPLPILVPSKQHIPETGFIDADTCTTASGVASPVTPKSESQIASDEEPSRKRKRTDSEDSDETYTPCVEYTPRKYRRKKPRLPIKDMIRVLEGSKQLNKARRGRPPKRRESAVSSMDDNASTSSNHEERYRELRDKNNEASKRSRMNRKLKELQMEQHAIELEERNKKLKVRADVLEDMTKRLKDALMTAILNK